MPNFIRYLGCADRYLVNNTTDTVTMKGGWTSALKAPSLLQLSPDWQSASCRGCFIVVGSKDLKVETREIVEFGLYSAGQKGLFEDVTASAGFQDFDDGYELADSEFVT